MKARLTHITAKYDGYCGECRAPIARNAVAVYDWKFKRTLCLKCGDYQQTEQAGLDLFSKQ
jgi:hypothetical protein